MLAPLRTLLLLVGVVGLCAASHEIRAADQSAQQPQICHRTNGAPAFLLLRVGGSAVYAHLAHGDHLPITFYRIGSPTDTVVACEAPPGYSDRPDGCAPVTSFTDGFDGATLDPKWLLVNGINAPCMGAAGAGSGRSPL